MTPTLQPLRQTPTPALRAEMTRLTAPETLRALTDAARSASLADRLQRTCQSVHDFRQDHAATYAKLRTGTHQLPAQARTQRTSLQGTCFGRHMETLVFLHSNGLLPSGARILQGGAGVFSWAHMDESVASGFTQLAGGLGFTGVGSTYETAELAWWGGPGAQIDVYEIDPDVIAAGKESMSIGVVIPTLQPLLMTGPKITFTDLQQPDSFGVQLMQAWLHYRRSFATDVAGRAIPLALSAARRDPDAADAWFVPIGRVHAEGIAWHHADWALAQFSGRYDLHVQKNLLGYLSTPLWLASLLRAIDRLALPGERAQTPYGGLLVMDVFDDPNAQIEFLTLCGLEQLSRHPASLQHHSEIVVAHRMEASPWLAERLEIQRQVGLLEDAA